MSNFPEEPHTMPLDDGVLFMDATDDVTSADANEVTMQLVEVEQPLDFEQSTNPIKRPKNNNLVPATTGSRGIHALSRVRKKNGTLQKAVVCLSQTLLNKNSEMIAYQEQLVAHQEQRWNETLDTIHNKYQEELKRKEEELRVVNETIMAEMQKITTENEAIVATLRTQIETIQAEKDNALAVVEQKLERLSRSGMVKQTSSQYIPQTSHNLPLSASMSLNANRASDIGQQRESSSGPELRPQPEHRPVQIAELMKRHQGISNRITLQADIIPPQINSQEKNVSNIDNVDPRAIADAIADSIRTILQETHGTSHTSLPRERSCRRVSDEKISLADEKKKEHRTLRLRFLETTRLIIKERLGLDCDEDITSHDPISQSAIRLFEETHEGGPDLDDLRLDMKGKHLSEWNQAVARLLTIDFRNQQEDHGLPERSDGYLQDLFLEKIKRLRTIWRDAQPHTNTNGTIETVQDLERRLFRKKVTVAMTCRRNTRRDNKYNWRIRTVTATLELKQADKASDIKIWAWLKDLLEYLGPEGMSSDESCTDGIETVYRIKILPWRHNVENALDIIDRQRILDTDIFSPRGSKPAKRIRSQANPISVRREIKGLPRALYNDAWYQLKPEDYREKTLCVSKTQFERIGNLISLVQS